MVVLIFCFIASSLLVGITAHAQPKLYSYDDAGVDGFKVGTGVFLLDVGEALGEYDATEVYGSGDGFGTWRSVRFSALEGSFSSLVISNLVDAHFELSFPAIGGKEIKLGSRGDLEWEHFITQALGAGVRITPQAAAVPDIGPSLGMTLMLLSGVCWWGKLGRRQHLRSNVGRLTVNQV